MAKCSSSIQEALGSMPSTAKFIRQLFLVDLKIEKPRRKQSFEVERKRPAAIRQGDGVVLSPLQWQGSSLAFNMTMAPKESSCF